MERLLYIKSRNVQVKKCMGQKTQCNAFWLHCGGSGKSLGRYLNLPIGDDSKKSARCAASRDPAADGVVL